MSLDWLPKAGEITEKKMADFWNGAGTIAMSRSGNAQFALSASGRTVYVPSTNGHVLAVAGRVVTVSSNSDLSVELNPNTTSYVYLVLDMAGGGTNVVGARLIATQGPEYIPFSIPVAKVLTDATSVLSTNYLSDRRFPCAYSYRVDYNAGFPNPYFNGGAVWFGGTEVTGTTPTKILRLYAEKAGTMRVAFRLARSGLTTAYAKVYAASTGATPQISVTSTSSLGTDFDLTAWAQEGDILEMEIYNSSTSGTTTISLIAWDWDIMAPIAPALLRG